MTNRLRLFTVIYLSLILGLLLAIFPLPIWAKAFRPDWVALLLIYWCVYTPNTVGLVTAAMMGILLDTAMGTLLGQHALGLSLIAYAALKNHQRLRLFPRVQQCLIILLLVFGKQVLLLWIYGITKRAPQDVLLYFMPSITSMLLWPLVYKAMRFVQRRFLFADA